MRFETVSKEKTVSAGKTFTLDHFGWDTCPIIADHDPEILQVKSNYFWVNPVFTAKQKGVTHVTILLPEIIKIAPYVKVSQYVYEITIN